MTRKFTVTSHAVGEATKKLGVPADKAKNWILENVAKAKFVSEIIGESGNPCRLFAYNRVAYILDRFDPVVITVYPQNESSESLRAKVEQLITQAIEEITDKERRTERRVERRKAQLMVEAAEWNLKRVRARSQARIDECTANIETIDKRMVALDEELAEVRREKRRMAKSAVMYFT